MRQSRPAHLRLYVAGASPQSTKAVRAMKAWCDGTTPFEVVDVYRRPALAIADGVTAVPCVVNLKNGRGAVLRGDMPVHELSGRLGVRECE